MPMLSNVAMLTILILAPIVFILLFFFTAPYGRHGRAGWGPGFSARLGWIVMESPALLVIAIVVLAGGGTVSPAAFVFLLVWEVHYVYRTCLFPFLIRDSGRRMPMVVAGMAFFFNCLNGYANGTWLAITPNPMAGGPIPGLRVGIGLAMFVGGFVTHVWADRDLRRLREPGEVGYRIPRGGLFDLVASPNYFGEIVEWTGWAIATWSLPGLAFALFTVANLAPRAHAHREWYRSTFADYPSARKRLIPFLY